jgi:hypothetical protein
MLMATGARGTRGLRGLRMCAPSLAGGARVREGKAGNLCRVLVALAARSVIIDPRVRHGSDPLVFSAAAAR